MGFAFIVCCFGSKIRFLLFLGRREYDRGLPLLEVTEWRLVVGMTFIVD